MCYQNKILKHVFMVLFISTYYTVTSIYFGNMATINILGSVKYSHKF